MMKLFRRAPQLILVILAFVLLGVIVAYFVWGIGTVIGAVGKAVNANPGSGAAAGFDIHGAQQLNLRGLVNQ